MVVRMPKQKSSLDLGSMTGAVVPARRRIRWLVLGFLAVIACAWLMWLIFRGWTTARLERLINAEVPPNGSRPELESFFDRHGIPHGYFDGTEPSGFNADVAKKAGFDGRNLGGVVQGEIENANESMLMYNEIFIYFFIINRAGQRDIAYMQPFMGHSIALTRW
jgi:hypothetical protein